VAKRIEKSNANSVDDLNKEGRNGETVAQKTQSVIAKIGENVTIRRFARYEAAPGAALGTYIHAGGRIGVMGELVANNKSDRAADVARDVAMHIAPPRAP